VRNEIIESTEAQLVFINSIQVHIQKYNMNKIKINFEPYIDLYTEHMCKIIQKYNLIFYKIL